MAAVGKGALDCQRRTPSLRVPSTPLELLDGVDHSYYRDLVQAPSNSRQNVVATVKRKVFRGSRSRKLGE